MSNSKFFINGKGVENYSIVYLTEESQKEYNEKNAQLLKEAIDTVSEGDIAVLPDTEACATECRICIGNGIDGVKAAEMEYLVKVTEKDIYIVGGGLMSDWLAVKMIIEKHFTEKSEGVTVENDSATLLDVTSCPKTEGTEFRVMTYNILVEYPSWGTYLTVEMRSEPFMSIINVYDPDVVGLQEVSEKWDVEILNKLSDKYTFVYQNTPDGKFINLSTIIYKHDKFDLVDSGLQYFSYDGPNKIRLVTWANLKDKATGKQFIFFNTHWCFYKKPDDAPRRAHSIENAVIINKVMADHPEAKYAFSTADYNTTLDVEHIPNFTKAANLVNSLDLARESGTLMNDAGGCSKPGTSRKDVPSYGPIDHIFVTDDMKILRYETILWNCVEHVSDHSPKYADIVLGK